MSGESCSSQTYNEALELEIISNDGYIAELKWNRPKILYGHYKVFWHCDGHLLEESTGSEEYFMRTMQPGSTYTATVNVGASKSSNRIILDAAPLPPTKVEVTNEPNSPDTGLIVKFDNSDYRSKDFRITWCDLNTDIAETKETQNCLYVIKNLKQGTKYAVYVQSLLSTKHEKDKVLESQKSMLTFKQTYPAQIAEVKAEKTSPRSYCLSWKSVPSATTYEIMIKRKNGNYSKMNSSFAEIECSDLERGSEFLAKVAAVNDAGRGEFSQLAEFQTDPDTPSNVRAILDKDNPIQLHVLFDEPHNKPHQYIIRLNETEVLKTTKNEETILVDLGQIYRVSVQSMNEEEDAGSELVYSKSVTTRPEKVMKPEIIHKTDTSVTIRWSGMATAQNYMIKLTGDSSNIFQTNDETFTLSNLAPGKNFLIAVAAGNHSGQGKYSESLTFQTIPQAPHNIEVKNYQPSPSDSFLISFKYPSIYEDAQFIIHAQALTNEKITCTTTKCLEVIKNLVPGETYSISVEAQIDGRKSRKAQFSEVIMTYPNKVQVKDVKLENSCIVLEWDPLEISPNEYRVFVKTQHDMSDFVVKCGTTFTLSSIKPSTNYNFTVAAVNKAGCGAVSDEISFKTAPSAPVNVKVRNNLAAPETSLIVEYEDPDPSEKSYIIYAFPSSNKEERPVFETKSSTAVAILNDLTPGERYRVYVVAVQWGLTSKRAYFMN